MLRVNDEIIRGNFKLIKPEVKMFYSYTSTNPAFPLVLPVILGLTHLVSTYKIFSQKLTFLTL